MPLKGGIINRNLHYTFHQQEVDAMTPSSRHQLSEFRLGENLDRFPSAKHFVSYSRLAPTSKLSNGKSKGESNAKNGNAYLSWAFTELANLVVRFNPEAKAFYDRTFRRVKLRVKAIRILAAKLARAIFKMLETGEVFDIKRCFAG